MRGKYQERTRNPIINRFKVKVAGGAAAQTLALINAISLKNITRRDFEIMYYPESTGTYWPFEIEFLLKPEELCSVTGVIKGYINTESHEKGKIIRDHPLQLDSFSYEHLLVLMRKLRLEFPLRYLLQRELAVEANPKRLKLFNSWTRSISGGFPPIFSSAIADEMNKRFDKAHLDSPFRKMNDIEKYICIHYRIGDKRTNFKTNFNDHDGIFNPKTFAEILSSIQKSKSLPIYVISDEPTVALKLLREVGIQVETFSGRSDIWRDLFLASQAEILIGSWSQVSQLAAICVYGNGGKSFLPLSSKNGRSAKWRIPSNVWFSPKILDPSHWIYQAP